MKKNPILSRPTDLGNCVGIDLSSIEKSAPQTPPAHDLKKFTEIIKGETHSNPTQRPDYSSATLKRLESMDKDHCHHFLFPSGKVKIVKFETHNSPTASTPISLPAGNKNRQKSKDEKTNPPPTSSAILKTKSNLIGHPKRQCHKIIGKPGEVKHVLTIVYDSSNLPRLGIVKI